LAASSLLESTSLDSFIGNSFMTGLKGVGELLFSLDINRLVLFLGRVAASLDFVCLTELNPNSGFLISVADTVD